MMNHSANANDFVDQWEENAKRELSTGCLSYETFAMLQWCWSRRTFGPRYFRGPLGPLDHMEKEIEEVRKAYLECVQTEAPSMEVKQERQEKLLEELADVQILLFDVLWRAGLTVTEHKQAVTAKYVKNKERVWPDWTKQDPQKAIEHIRKE